MVNKIIIIGIIEPSQLLYEGFTSILLKNNSNFRIYKIDDLEEVYKTIKTHSYDIVLINPFQVQNRLKLFKTIRNENPTVKWIGIVYSLFEPELLSFFDSIISVNDNSKTILDLIKKNTIEYTSLILTSSYDQLTEREIGVLLLVVKGHSNKIIAEKLKISIHTVISHRKNITQKTGIKSQSGLTIFALSNKLINLDSI